MEAILQVERLSRRFGGLAALDDLSFAIRSGEIRGLIGPNGAGKTTTFNVISGFYAPSSGRVLFEGRDISGQRTSRVAALGLVRTFQQTTLFQELSVLDNVLVGGHLRARRILLVTLRGLLHHRSVGIELAHLHGFERGEQLCLLQRWAEVRRAVVHVLGLGAT